MYIFIYCNTCVNQCSKYIFVMLVGSYTYINVVQIYYENSVYIKIMNIAGVT